MRSGCGLPCLTLNGVVGCLAGVLFHPGLRACSSAAVGAAELATGRAGQWSGTHPAAVQRRLDVSPLQATGLAPEARGYHSFTAFGQGRCVAIGGRSHHNRLCEDGAMVAVYDAAARRWLQPGALLAARASLVVWAP